MTKLARSGKLPKREAPPVRRRTARGDRRMRSRAVILAATIVAACNYPTAPDQERRLAEIAGYVEGDPQIGIEVDADSVRVQVTSYGGGCHRKGETEVDVANGTATVVPFDYVVNLGDACPDILRSFIHDVAIPVSAGGIATVRVRGIDGSTGDTLVVEREVAGS